MTNNLFRFHNNDFNSMPCKLDSTEFAHSFLTKPNLALTLSLRLSQHLLTNSFFVLFPYCTSRIGRTTSRCASLRHAHDLSLILMVSLIWSGLSIKTIAALLHSVAYNMAFPSIMSIGKNDKTEVGTEAGESVKKNPTQIWLYLCGILFNSFPN